MATPLTAPAPAVVADDPAVSTDVAPVATPQPVYVSLTQEQLDRMLAAAVLAGQAQSGPAGAAAAAVAAEKPELWTVNELLRNVIAHIRWYNERTLLSALNTVDTHFPAPGEEA